jgi:hypothetical protein
MPDVRDVPAVLVGARTALIRQLEPDRVLLNALTAAKHPSAYGPVIALHSVEATLAAARMQQRRIARARRSPPGRRFKGNALLFADIHFYLICWARTAKLTRFIWGAVRFSRLTEFKRTRLALKRYHKHLDEMIDARDHLEHLEERLPGQQKHRMLKVPNDLMNLSGAHLTFGGDRFDIGPSSLRRLVTFVDEFRTAVLFDAIETLVALDRKRLDSLVRQAALVLRRARIVKQTARFVGLSPNRRLTQHGVGSRPRSSASG